VRTALDFVETTLGRELALFSAVDFRVKDGTVKRIGFAKVSKGSGSFTSNSAGFVLLVEESSSMPWQ